MQPLSPQSPRRSSCPADRLPCRMSSAGSPGSPWRRQPSGTRSAQLFQPFPRYRSAHDAAACPASRSDTLIGTHRHRSRPRNHAPCGSAPCTPPAFSALPHAAPALLRCFLLLLTQLIWFRCNASRRSMPREHNILTVGRHPLHRAAQPLPAKLPARTMPPHVPPPAARSCSGHAVLLLQYDRNSARCLFQPPLLLCTPPSAAACLHPPYPRPPVGRTAVSGSTVPPPNAVSSRSPARCAVFRAPFCIAASSRIPPNRPHSDGIP